MFSRCPPTRQPEEDYTNRIALRTWMVGSFMTHPLFDVFSPGLAVGAAAAAVAAPLIIHLLFRKRYQIVPWAAIRFLLVAERRHKRRIDQWLLLVLRTLALVLFLLAMVATTEWAEKLWQAENLIRSGNPGDGFTILKMTGTAETVVQGPSNDPDKVVAELRKVKPTHGPADHTAALGAVADILT